MKNKAFSVLDIGKEFLRQKGNKSVCKLADIIGLKLFSMLLMNSELQGLHIIFPKQSTLQKITMRTQIRGELQGLKGEKFKTKVTELSKLFGKDRCQIRNEFAIAKGHPRKKNY